MKQLLVVLSIIAIVSCKPEIHREYVMEPCPEEVKPSAKALKDSLTAKGFQTFDYVDETTKDAILMQKYFMVFLKKGISRSQSKAEADSL